MKFCVSYRNQTWSVVKLTDSDSNSKWKEPKVTCEWYPKESDRLYSIIVYGDSSSKALEKGEFLINEYIKNHEDPINSIKDIISGEAHLWEMQRCIHELSRAVLILSGDQSE